MKTISKKSLVILFSLITTFCVMASAIFFMGSVKASADESEPPAIVMENGASARVTGDEVNGLRFIATMTNDEYAWFSKNVGEDKTYASVKFGMFIAPANYLSDYADFTEDNLFGATPKYDWAVFTDGQWVYSGNNGATVEGEKTPVRIINIVTNKMQTYVDNDGNEKMATIGSIIDYKEHNIVKDFVGRGYYQLLDGAGVVVETVLADYANENVVNNTRSMIGVVQTAIEKDALDSEQVDCAKATYFDTIADNVSVKNERVEVLMDTTVAGNTYSGEKTSYDLTDVIYTSDTGVTTQFKLNSWITQSTALKITNGVLTAKGACAGSVIYSEVFENLIVRANASMPISSRADLDALGFAYLAGKENLWDSGNRYILTNDIDYATDTSTYGNFRMNDGNGTVDFWDRYLIPIAASYNGYKGTANWAAETGSVAWGIFGKIGADGEFFYGVIDGAGYAIKNAVIPYGTLIAEASIYCSHGQNFIGSLVYGAQLKNIAFTGLEFEDPSQIGKAAGQNPYYDSTKNENIVGTRLATTPITQTGMKGAYGYEFYNPSNRTGIVGLMQNAVISNVYVEAAIKNGTFGWGAVNGMLVANIDVDAYNGGSLLGGTSGTVENCIVKTSYSDATNVHYFGAFGNSRNTGMGAVVGRSYLDDASAINNCFVIGTLSVDFVDGNGSTVIDTIFSPNLKNFMSGKYAGKDLSTNCGFYSSASALQTAQAQALANMSIAKYLG